MCKIFLEKKINKNYILIEIGEKQMKNAESLEAVYIYIYIS